VSRIRKYNTDKRKTEKSQVKQTAYMSSTAALLVDTNAKVIKALRGGGLAEYN
jgi:hypothetical protein